MLAKGQEVSGHKREEQGGDAEAGKTDSCWGTGNSLAGHGPRECVGGVG